MIKNVSIIGVGTQGAQIAFRAAVYGKKAAVYDLSEKTVEQCKAKIQDWLSMYKEEGRLDGVQAEEVLKRLHYFGDLKECLADCDLAIEVVPEKVELKRVVWEQIDKAAPEKTIITTNSSSLKCSDIFGGVERKDRTFNLNFMTPVKDDLVEVMWNAYTSERTRQEALDFLKSLKLVPIVTNIEIKGFSHNRVWRAIKKEVLKLWSQGYCDHEDLDRAFMLEFGTAFGPFGLMDVVGLDVIRDIEISYYNESKDESDLPPAALLDMIQEGRLGVKSGKGFYEYPNPAYEQEGWMRAKTS